MITINLLPPEFRVKDRTPLPMLLGILGGVVLCVLVLLVFIYCHIVWLPKVDTDLTDLKNELASKEKGVREYNDLVKKKKGFESLDNMVKDIEQGKEHWASYLRDLVLIFNDAEQKNEQLKVWMSDLSFSAAGKASVRRGSSPAGGKISFKGDIAGHDFSLYSDFVEEVSRKKEGRVLYKRIHSIIDPRLSIKEHQGYEPDKSVSFPFEITLTVKEKKKAPRPGKKPVKPPAKKQ